MRKVLAFVGAFVVALATIAFVATQPASAAGPNLIGNPSAETNASGVPTGWSQGGWGTNTPTYTYTASGCQAGTRCLTVKVAGYSSGDAKWYPAPVAVTPSKLYTFSDYFKSTATSDLEAAVTSTSGATSYIWLGTLNPATAWTQLSYDFTTPADAASVTFYHALASNGTLSTDNYSLTLGDAIPPPPNGNIVPNPGLESINGTSPQSWSADSWGTNKPTFTYLNTGHAGSHSVRVAVTGYTNGSANWDYAPQPVTAGQTYQFTDWYQSNASTEIDAAVTMSDGTVGFYYLSTVLASTAWAQVKAQFTVPAGATKIAVYHVLAKNGTLTTDDYGFQPYTPVPLTRGLVSYTFDDGWTNQYTNALPLLTKNAVPATFYIISGELTDQPDYMTGAQVKALSTAGHEIGSHTVHHCDLTGVQTDDPTNCPTPISASKVDSELKNSQTTLQTTIGKPVTDFAYPYGAYNAATVTAAAKYYKSQRTVDSGYNTKDNTVVTRLVVQNVFTSTTPADVQNWINQAAKDKSWLVLVYHEVGTTPTDPTVADYLTTPTQLDQELAAGKNSGLGVVTVNQALAEITPQLG